jgi:hypothetical protein
MAQPFLALITPIGGDAQPPLGIWGGSNQPFPTPPIYMPPGGGGGGRPPLGIWGGGGVGNYPDAGFPGPQPGGPIGIWGGGGVGPYPDHGLPGPQPGGPTYPSQGPGFPTNPIVLPPPPGTGEGAPPIAVQLPIFPWTPSHPIELPDIPTPPGIEWKAAWTPQTGWVVVGLPSGEHVTPSR